MHAELAILRTVGDPAVATNIKVKLEGRGIYVELSQTKGSKHGLGYEIEYSVRVSPSEVLRAEEILSLEGL